jgi:pyruvate dehydrogenase (quinone)
MKLSADKRSMRNPGARSSTSWSPPLSAPPADQLKAAAAVLNAGSRIAVLAGQGALSARDEVTQLADVLGVPVAKALLGKAVLPDDSPFTTGGIGDLGTAPSSWAMQSCDTVLILGSTMPWVRILPEAGTGPRRPGRPQAGPPWLALPRRDRLDGRRQGDIAGTAAAADAQVRP